MTGDEGENYVSILVWPIHCFARTGSFVVFTLSRGLIKFQPDMGWTGRSWIFTNLLGDSTTRLLASVLYILATVGLVVSGVGGLAVFSAVVILLMWDGGLQWIVQKRLIGFLISALVLIALLLLKWPIATF